MMRLIPKNNGYVRKQLKKMTIYYGHRNVLNHSVETIQRDWGKYV